MSIGDTMGVFSIPAFSEEVSSVTIGGYHACAIVGQNIGKVVCWGLQAYKDTSSLANVVIVSLSAGFTHTCAVTSSGRL
jgi:alpha-tubulin suppressor-like RCC1 family protein